jgi:hypothetical protein
MRPVNAVLAHRDAASAGCLAASLKNEFRNLAIVRSSKEVCAAVAQLRAPFAVVDLELVSLAELKDLCARFRRQHLSAFIASLMRGCGRKLWRREPWIAASRMTCAASCWLPIVT